MTRDAALTALAALTFAAALWMPPVAAPVVLTLWVLAGLMKGKRR